MTWMLVQSLTQENEIGMSVESHNTHNDGRGENMQILSRTYISCLHDIFFNKYWSKFVRCFVCNKPQRTLQKITVLSHKHTTQHSFSPVCV